MITIPVTLAQFIACVFIILPALCALCSLEAAWWYARENRLKVKAEKAELELRKRLLDERKAIQLNRDNDLRVREEAVALAEGELRERARAIETAINIEEKDFDTMISVLPWDEMPHPGEWDDTVAMPAIEEE